MRLSPVAFWYLRHGETDWNVQGLSQGRTDIPLNDNGLAQARAAAATLAGRRFAGIVASPLSRAHVTAQIVGAAVGLPVVTDPELQEAEFGTLEGRRMAQAFDDWVAERSTPEGAESFATLRVRAVATLNRLLASPAPLLVVGHGAFFRALRSAMGLPANVRLPNATPILCQPDGVTWRLQPA